MSKARKQSLPRAISRGNAAIIFNSVTRQNEVIFKSGCTKSQKKYFKNSEKLKEESKR